MKWENMWRLFAYARYYMIWKKKKTVRQLISDSFKDLFMHLRVTLPLFNLSSLIYILRRHMLISYDLKFMLPTNEYSGEM